MRKYRVSVCKGPDCRAGGSDEVFQALRQQLPTSPAGPRCTVGRGGCYGLCHLGPNVIVRVDDGRPRDPFSREDFQLMGWEGEVHYGNMTPERVPALVDRHLAGDQEIPEFAPRDNGRSPRSSPSS
jgi:(2Fe-2S) ferredoxin